MSADQHKRVEKTGQAQPAVSTPERTRDVTVGTTAQVAYRRAVAAPPPALRAADIRALQRTVGNRAVQRMLEQQNPKPTRPPEAAPAEQPTPASADLQPAMQKPATTTSGLIQRVLFDMGNGLFVNYSYVILPYGMVLMQTSDIPVDWPRTLQADGEWVFYHPAVIVPPPMLYVPAPLPQPVIDLDQGNDEEAYDQDQQDQEQLDHEEAEALTVQDLMDHYTYVPQDDREDHYFIGKAIAYTYNLSTCTAVALYHAPTGLSYLRHADSHTEPEQVRLSVNEYIQKVLDTHEEDVDLSQDIQVTIFVPAGVENEPGESLYNITQGIAAVGANEVVINLFEHAEIVEDMQRQYHVVVGGGEEPDYIDPGHQFSTLEYTLRQIIDSASEDDEGFYDGTVLDVVREFWKHSKPYEIIDALEEDVVRQALQVATMNNLDEVADILGKIIAGEAFPEEIVERDSEIEDEVRRRLEEATRLRGKMSWADEVDLEEEIRAQVTQEFAQGNGGGV